MVFSSYEFLLVFLPAVVAGYYALSHLKNPLYQKVFLLLASLFFYGYYHVSYVWLILGSIAANYLIARLIQWKNDGPPALRKTLLTVGVLFNVLLIGYYKYYDFFIENINALTGADLVLQHVALPLGISFFTFQQLSFLISVYQKEEKVESLLNYSLFVTFFPQLVAGPIVLYSEMIPQFKNDDNRHFQAENFAEGLYMFGIGMFKKAVIADTLALFVDHGFTGYGPGELSMASAWITSLSYTLQIYFDFSGYSDMAIGLGRLFNIHMPYNFNSPYKSESVTEFWRRWHMTLGRALSTYVYKPLGGNRHGLPRTCINLFLTFLVSGLWHGAAWTFVLWGVLHGVIVVLERIFGKYLQKIPKWIRIAVTFLLINFLWVLFRAESFEQAMAVYTGMFNFSNIGIAQLQHIVDDGIIGFPKIIDYAYIFGLTAILLGVVFFARNSVERLERFSPTVPRMIATLLLFAASFMCLSRESIFIYFNF